VADLIAIEAEDQAADIIDTLERVLEKARAGELSSVAVALVYRNGSVGHRRSALPSFPVMVGALNRLIHKLNLDMDAG
jgi:hypothetical protein